LNVILFKAELRKALGEKDDLLIEYEAKLKEIQLEVTKLNSDKSNFQSDMKSEKKRATQIEKNIKDVGFNDLELRWEF
jgi:hypothetical protein